MGLQRGQPHIGLLASLVAAFLGVAVANAEQKLVRVDIPFTKYVLTNGLTLIVHEDHKAPLVTVNVWYHVGSKNEIAGRTGFAHLFEHLMFNGSEHFNDDYFKLVEPEGATTLNGTTDFDRTNYFQDAPVSALDLILWAEADRMGFLIKAVDQAKLDEQRGVVLNEKRQGENQPYGKVFEVLFEAAFPKGHPYSWTPIGHAEDLEAASLKDVHQWFTNYYGAANAFICIAGDITPETAKAKVEKFFGSIPSGPPVARPEVWISRSTGVKRLSMQDRVKLPAIWQVWGIPQAGTIESDRLSLVADILSAGKTSRLYKRLVYDDQIAVDVAAFPFAAEIAGLFGIQVMARPGVDLARVEKAVDEEVARFLRDGPTKAELERAKNRQVASFIRGVERIGGFGGKSDILLQNEVFSGDPAFYKVTQERIQTATARQLLETARAWLSDGKTILQVHPYPEYSVVADNLDRSVRPSVGEPPKARFPAFDRFELENGLKVVVMENRTIPMLLFRTIVQGGSSADPGEMPGLATMTMDMLDEGAGNRTTLQISDELSFLGAHFGAGATVDQCTIDLNTLKSTLEKALGVYQDILFNPLFPEKELSRLKKERLASIEMEKSTPDSMGNRVLPKLIYGAGHPYSSPGTGTGTPDAVNRMSVADLKRYYDTWLKPNNATLLIVGDTTAAEIRPVVQKYFGAWKRGDVPGVDLPNVSHRATPSLYLIDKPGAEQSVIFAGHVAPPTHNPEEMALLMLNNVLGGKFTSRINMNLREDKHWSYGAGSWLSPARGQRPFVIQAPVQTDKTADSIREIRKELEAIAAARPLSDAELTDTRKQEMLGLAGRWETMSGQLGALTDLIWFGYPDDYWSKYAERVAKTTVKDARKATGTLLQPQSMVWVVVGDRARIQGDLQELGLGPVQHLDSDGNPVQSPAL